VHRLFQHPGGGSRALAVGVVHHLHAHDEQLVRAQDPPTCRGVRDRHAEGNRAVGAFGGQCGRLRLEQRRAAVQGRRMPRPRVGHRGADHQPIRGGQQNRQVRRHVLAADLLVRPDRPVAQRFQPGQLTTLLVHRRGIGGRTGQVGPHGAEPMSGPSHAT
jgi:hypothetical protein